MNSVVRVKISHRVQRSKIGLDNERILIITAVTAEKDAVLRGLRHDQRYNQRYNVLEVGVGPVAAAASTAKELSSTQYSVVISAGIGGGFSGKAEVGSVVIANHIIAADLGVETSNGFRSMQELGFGSNKIETDRYLVNQVVEALLAAKLPVGTGPIITVSTATGTAASALEMTRRVPGVVAEAMEGYGVALAAFIYGVPVLEIRAISNRVGPRDLRAWRMKEAFEALEKAFGVLAKTL